jgi:hypothetical protein
VTSGTVVREHVLEGRATHLYVLMNLFLRDQFRGGVPDVLEGEENNTTIPSTMHKFLTTRLTGANV